MTATVVRLLRFASIAICLIVAASFVTFAVGQTKTASGHQQEELTSPAEQAARAQSKAPARHESGVHEALDEVSGQLTSPFAGIVSASSEWASRGAKLLLALLVYGFGLGYLARVLRVKL